GGGFAAFAGVLEGSGPVLEELFLPAVEEGRMDAVLVAQVGDRLLLQQMKPQDGYLLRGRVVLAWGAHGMILRGECYRQPQRRQIPTHAEPLHSWNGPPWGVLPPTPTEANSNSR